MAQTTTTLIQAANDVLLGIGERPITNFGSNLGLKIKSAMVSSTYDVGVLDDWSWLQSTKNADAWDGNKAILNNRRRLYRVLYQPAAGQPYHYVRYQLPEVFEKQTLIPYSSNAYPVYYTTDSELSVRLNPYPTIADEQVKVWFVTAEAIQPPTTVNDTFPVPERFLELIKKRALYYMALRHLDDSAMAAMFNNEFELLAQRLRDTERSHTVGELNMFRRR